MYCAPLGALMATTRLWAEPEWFIRDRAFRLRHNESQVRLSLSVSYTPVSQSGSAVWTISPMSARYSEEQQPLSCPKSEPVLSFPEFQEVLLWALLAVSSLISPRPKI
jgi:hypothetical protein